MNSIKDVSYTKSIDNNYNSKKAYKKTDFSGYNIINSVGGDRDNIKNANNIDNIDNNFYSKKAYTKAGFSINNNTSLNTNINVIDISCIRDAIYTIGMNNHLDGKKAHKKASFNIYNVANIGVN